MKVSLACGSVRLESTLYTFRLGRRSLHLRLEFRPRIYAEYMASGVM